MKTTQELTSATELLMDLIAKTEEFGDSCLLWTKATNPDGYPIFKHSKQGCQLVRRTVFLLDGGELKCRQPLQMVCEEKACINPAHMRATSWSAVGKTAAKKPGAWKGITRRQRIADARRGKMKLTMDQAREIRNSDESGPVLALRYGIDKSMVNRIKVGKAWVELNNPYLALVSANSTWSQHA